MSSDTSSSQTLVDDALVLSLPMELETECPVPWTTSQMEALTGSYPVVDDSETVEDYVIRRYLEVLWLPESIMPLHDIILTLSRVTHADPMSSDVLSRPHPLHALLDPLILTGRGASNKYQVALPQTLANGEIALVAAAGDGEEEVGNVEEDMMWFAWNHEKVASDSHDEQEKRGEDLKWQQGWLERMEKREVLIQILLLMLKLSLSGPCPSLPPPSDPSLPAPSFPDSPQRRGRKRKRGDEPAPILAPPQSPEDRLESLMDKLAVWAVMDIISEEGRASYPRISDYAPQTGTNGATRDWTQIFCEDVVEPLFKDKLPEFCSLLRSKVFPSDFYSDTDTSDEFDPDGKFERDSPGPDILIDSPPSSQNSLPGVSHESRSLSRPREPSRATSRDSKRRSTSKRPTPAPLERSRSRSLSVSLAEDSARQRESFISRPVVNREVSMSRTFKGPTARAATKAKAKAKLMAKPAKKNTKSSKTANPSTQGITLVEATPEKPRYAAPSYPSIKEEEISDSEAEEDVGEVQTPTKRKGALREPVY